MLFHTLSFIHSYYHDDDYDDDNDDDFNFAEMVDDANSIA
jgi:hypothetical protein